MALIKLWVPLLPLMGSVWEITWICDPWPGLTIRRLCNSRKFTGRMSVKTYKKNGNQSEKGKTNKSMGAYAPHG